MCGGVVTPHRRLFSERTKAERTSQGRYKILTLNLWHRDGEGGTRLLDIRVGGVAFRPSVVPACALIGSRSLACWGRENVHGSAPRDPLLVLLLSVLRDGTDVFVVLGWARF